MFVEGLWPWWLGALALGATCFGYPLLLGRSCTVSGFWGGVVNWRQEREAARAEAELAANPQAAEEAMLEAAMAELGGEIPEEIQAELEAMAAADPELTAPPTHAAPPRTAGPWGFLTFLVGLAAGGFIAALGRGEASLSLTMSPTFQAIFGSGALLALAFGGLLVGFGTQMAGGCSMGHGLSGTSNLQPGSLLSTASFMGTAVVVSMILGRLI